MSKEKTVKITVKQLEELISYAEAWSCEAWGTYAEHLELRVKFFKSLLKNKASDDKLDLILYK